MLVRTSQTRGHSHVLELPDPLPEQLVWFFTKEDPRDGHSHAVHWGGPEKRYGVFQTDAGWTSNDEAHVHVFEVMA